MNSPVKQNNFTSHHTHRQICQSHTVCDSNRNPRTAEGRCILSKSRFQKRFVARSFPKGPQQEYLLPTRGIFQILDHLVGWIHKTNTAFQKEKVRTSGDHTLQETKRIQFAQLLWSRGHNPPRYNQQRAKIYHQRWSLP